MGFEIDVKLIVRPPGNLAYKVPVNIESKDDDNRLFVSFGYDEQLIQEIKVMEGARWNPDEKCWTISDTRRNQFRLAYMMGHKVYARFERKNFVRQYKPIRPEPKAHQILLTNNWINTEEHIFAADMGVGKTLAAIEGVDWIKENVITNLESGQFWWVGPNSALAALEEEIDRWGISVYPEIMTYEGMTNRVERWQPGKPAPRIIVFDESSRLKNPRAKRTGSALHVTEAMRREWRDKNLATFILEMTGTPSPKEPTDWYSQCEIACPGFVREGNVYKFRARLAHQVQQENQQTGGVYFQTTGWKDSTLKCDKCGKLESHDCHHQEMMFESYHPFEPGTDEVSKLYKRLDGLVTVVMKKDVLKDLPAKIYRVLRVKPTLEIKNALKLVERMAKGAAQAMILARELSDGFLYESAPNGTKTCSHCQGKKTVESPVYCPQTEAEVEGAVEQTVDHMETISCPTCGGSGEVPAFTRAPRPIHTAKDDIVTSLLEDQEDQGRIVLYAGFTASIDKLCDLVTKSGWKWIRLDGRGWATSLADLHSRQDLLRVFQKKSFCEDDRRIAFIGHPGSAGMGLTLTASSMICFYSNDFNAESRIQAEDRIHRMSMDLTRGATIVDLVHLPTDELVLKNLQQKRDLQALTMGQVREALATLGDMRGD